METQVRRISSAAAGALLGTMVADALCADYEGAPPVRADAVPDRITRALRGRPLRYTDDTQMALGLAEHCCAVPHVDTDALAALFVDRYEAWRGYGGGMRILVELLRNGTPVAEATTAVFPDGSLGNGSAMRVAPVGVLWAHDDAALAEAATRSARATHVHPVGIDAAVLQARAVAMATERGRFARAELRELRPATAALDEGLAAACRLLDGGTPSRDLPQIARRLGNEVVAHRSVPAALWAAAAASSFSDAVGLAMGIGGDTDTIAAMAGAVRGAAEGPGAIPAEWLAAVDDEPYGRAYAADVAERLSAVAVAIRGG